MRRAAHPPAARRPGFTLVELMVVLAITAVLALAAAPSFSRLIATQRMRSMSSDLMSTLTRARSEAIKRNTDVTVVPLSASRWEDGWNLLNPGDNSILEAHAAIASATIIGPAEVVFQANGRMRGTSAPEFDISVSTVDDHRCVRLDLSGRPYQKNEAC